jgi:hypothetical protein
VSGGRFLGVIDDFIATAGVEIGPQLEASLSPPIAGHPSFP